MGITLSQSGQMNDYKCFECQVFYKIIIQKPLKILIKPLCCRTV